MPIPNRPMEMVGGTSRSRPSDNHDTGDSHEPPDASGTPRAPLS